MISMFPKKFVKKGESMFMRSILRTSVAFIFFSNMMFPSSVVQSGETLNLLPPGTTLSVSAKFNPALVMGLNIHRDNPFRFDFIMDKGDGKLTDTEFKHEAEKMIKYFLAALTVPSDQMWVNLSPYEKGRVVPEVFGVTEMGKDLLVQDYLLKQFTSTLMIPDQKLGAEFWKRVYARARELFGTTQVPVDTINKVWIVPDNAVIYEHEKGAFIVDSHLKVMTEQDYLALRMNKRNGSQTTRGAEKMSKVSQEVLKEVLLPEIEKEVNEGKLFSGLRQIYHAVLLATWYKQALSQSILGLEYADQMKTGGIEVADKKMSRKIYEQYVKAFKKGVYNVIREDLDPATHEIVPRKYFTGGIPMGEVTFSTSKQSGPAMVKASHMNGAIVTWDGTAITGEPGNQAMAVWGNVQPLTIGTSGLRANADKMTDREVGINTRGFLKYEMAEDGVQSGTPVALACDLRPSSPRISQAAGQAILDEGLKVQWLGELPTPALALWGFTHNMPSLMVTASHNPIEQNGEKQNKRQGELLKPDEKPMFRHVAEVRKTEDALSPEGSRFRVDNHMFKESVDVLSQAEDHHDEALQLYVDRYNVFKTAQNPTPLAGKKYVVYQHSAVGRDILVTILRNLGATVIAPEKYRLPRGQFKAIDTENVTPADKEFFKQLAAEYPDADAFISLDGDSDRPFVIDEHGNFHRGDVLGILGAVYLKADYVALPASANDAVDGILAAQGIELQKTEVGSPYVAVAMEDAMARGKKRPVGWEVNGGFLTGSDIQLPGGTLRALPTRDAVLPILTALLTAVEQNRSISEVFAQLETRFTGGGLKDDYPVTISAKILAALSPKVNDDTAPDYDRAKSVREVKFAPDGLIHVSFFDGRQQTLAQADPQAQEYTNIRTLAKRFLREEDGLGEIKAIDYVTGVRIQFANDDVVHLRYSKNKTTQFRVYTVANSQERADELSQKAVQLGGIYDDMRSHEHDFDRAMGRSEALAANGGIDLDQAMLNLRIEKMNQGVRIPAVAIPGFEIDKGLKPVIIKVVPFDIQNSPYLRRSGFSAGVLNVAINDEEP